MQAATNVTIFTKTKWFGIPKKTDNKTNNQIKNIEVNLAFLGIPLPSRKSLTYLPKYLLFKTQLNSLSELRKKQAAEIIIKGVVGKPGTIIPIKPTIVNKIPRESHKIRIKG